MAVTVIVSWAAACRPREANDDDHNLYCQGFDYGHHLMDNDGRFGSGMAAMKVSKAQVQANRSRVVETAAQLFQEHGYDGIGVAELMAAAGLTHGGFYKHFGSKADLMAEAAACGMAQRLATSEGADPADFIRHYLSREHRDARGGGCTLAALGGDAARKSEAVKATFAAGIENSLAAMAQGQPYTKREHRDTQIATLAQIVGALVLSRACPDDSPLADEILDACRRRLLAGKCPPVGSAR